MLIPEHLQKLLILLLTRSAGLILTFTVSLFLARMYGAETTGKYYLFISILTGLSVITKLGFNSALIKNCAQHSLDIEKERIRGYWYAANKISSITGIALILLIICTLSVYQFIDNSGSNYYLFAYACVALLPFTILGHNISVLTGLNQQTAASITETVAQPALFLILIISAYYYDSTREEIIALYTITLITVFGFSTTILTRKLHSERTIEVPDEKNFLSTSMPVLGINITNFLTDWSATYILAIFGTLSQIGIYNISWRLVTIMGILLVIINSINAPQYSKEFKNGNINNISIIARRSSRILFWLSLPVIILIIIFAKEIMALFGNDFIEGAAILQILAIGQMVNFFSGSVGYLLLMTGNEKQLRNITLGTCIVQIIALLVFIPIYNIYAAAIISALAVSLKNILSVYIAYKQIGVLSLPIPNKWFCLK